MDVVDMLVGPDYCRALGLPLLQGREIGPKDSPGSPAVAVVNKAFADYFFPGENPIGRRFGDGDDPSTSGDVEIVGVIGDARYTSPKKKAEPVVFRPILQVQDQGAYACDLEIRTAGEPLAVVSAVRSAIGQVDPKLPATTVTTLSKQLDDSLRLEKLVARLVSFFGLLALLLACLGLYGVMAHAVARRTNEIGVRMALGANHSRILRMVLRETLTLVAAGIAIGIPSALAAAHAISSQLHGLDPEDPWTLTAATLLLVCVAAIAGYLPARRASRVDPMVALRYE
jgi:predicted permease